MNSPSAFSLVLVTAPSLDVARALARAALNARLIACANLVPQVESHYWWENKIDASTEVLLLLKTTAARLKALEQLILAQHPYDTPEFVVVPLEAGSAKFLAWIDSNVGRGAESPSG